jgi:hypothetical protein
VVSYGDAVLGVVRGEGSGLRRDALAPCVLRFFLMTGAGTTSCHFFCDEGSVFVVRCLHAAFVSLYVLGLASRPRPRECARNGCGGWWGALTLRGCLSCDVPSHLPVFAHVRMSFLFRGRFRREAFFVRGGVGRRRLACGGGRGRVVALHRVTSSRVTRTPPPPPLPVLEAGC